MTASSSVRGCRSPRRMRGQAVVSKRARAAEMRSDRALRVKVPSGVQDLAEAAHARIPQGAGLRLPEGAAQAVPGALGQGAGAIASRSPYIATDDWPADNECLRRCTDAFDRLLAWRKRVQRHFRDRCTLRMSCVAHLKNIGEGKFVGK